MACGRVGKSAQARHIPQIGMKTLLIIGASKGLGKAFVEGLGKTGDTVIGVSRTMPSQLERRAGIQYDWITADFSYPESAIQTVVKALEGKVIDVLIYNLGVWEPDAFSESYDFLQDSDETVKGMVSINLVSPILLLKAILPSLCASPTPRVILSGSTSGLRSSGRPEVTFGATKAALHGLGDALREGYRSRSLAVTTLSLGYLNTEDDLGVPRTVAASRGEGQLIPVHDVVHVVDTILNLSDSSFVRDLTMPALKDSRF
jgi:short-subunit dehydrogenase